MFVDSHCHIHESEFYTEGDERDAVYQRAVSNNVRMICIGTSESFSRQAVEFANTHEHAWATVGVHPHDAKDGCEGIGRLLQEKHDSVVGVGEIGLDYFYDNSPRAVQISVLEQQLQWATDYQLSVSFHVRDQKSQTGAVWQDFWPIVDNFSAIRGVLHSFTDTKVNLEIALSRGFYIGVNGISTFSKTGQAMWDAMPLENMLLETDAPFLTPVPHRGTVNEPAFVRNVAEYHANRRGVELEHLARVTSANASSLFSL